jgi:GDP-L-fucose synthase
MRRLAREDCVLLTASHRECDLRRQSDVEAFVSKTRPQAVFLAAARVGGIIANDSGPASFIYDNLSRSPRTVIEAAALPASRSSLNSDRHASIRNSQPPMSEGGDCVPDRSEPTNQWYCRWRQDRGRSSSC